MQSKKKTPGPSILKISGRTNPSRFPYLSLSVVESYRGNRDFLDRELPSTTTNRARFVNLMSTFRRNDEENMVGSEVLRSLHFALNPVQKVPFICYQNSHSKSIIEGKSPKVFKVQLLTNLKLKSQVRFLCQIFFLFL